MAGASEEPLTGEPKVRNELGDEDSTRDGDEIGRCPHCGSTAIIRDEFRGEEICTRCGLVLVEKQLDRGPDWHTEPGGDSGRADVTTGLDIARHDLGLGSRMGRSNDLSPGWRARIRRLKTLNRRSRATTYEEKSLRQALINVGKMCEDLDLPKSVRAEICFLYRKMRSHDLTPGRDTWSVLATLAFIVSRIRGIPRTEEEVAHSLMARSGLGKREAYRALRRVRRIASKELDLDVPRSRPREYLDRFTTKLGLPEEIASKAHEICSLLPDDFKKNKAAYLLAASSVYVAAKWLGADLGIRELADALGVGVSSVSKTGKQIRELGVVHGG